MTIQCVFVSSVVEIHLPLRSWMENKETVSQITWLSTVERVTAKFEDGRDWAQQPLLTGT